MNSYIKDSCNFIKQETLAKEFLVNFEKILRTPIFIEYLRTTASEGIVSLLVNYFIQNIGTLKDIQKTENFETNNGKNLNLKEELKNQLIKESNFRITSTFCKESTFFRTFKNFSNVTFFYEDIKFVKDPCFEKNHIYLSARGSLIHDSSRSDNSDKKLLWITLLKFSSLKLVILNLPRVFYSHV